MNLLSEDETRRWIFDGYVNFYQEVRDGCFKIEDRHNLRLIKSPQSAQELDAKIEQDFFKVLKTARENLVFNCFAPLMQTEQTIQILGKQVVIPPPPSLPQMLRRKPIIFISEPHNNNK